jgi:hypothetical protein
LVTRQQADPVKSRGPAFCLRRSGADLGAARPAVKTSAISRFGPAAASGRRLAAVRFGFDHEPFAASIFLARKSGSWSKAGSQGVALDCGGIAVTANDSADLDWPKIRRDTCIVVVGASQNRLQSAL